ncbi:rRNA maturation RNase YbeY [bacterium]|nr:MAG: rRNA maturation RNase YbeY [bacterium]
MNSVTIEVANESGIQVPITQEKVAACINVVSKGEQKEFSLVEVVYVDANQIVEINTQHLERTYVTDIITFDYTDDEEDGIEGTLYCCAQRIEEQAVEFEENVNREFHRIVIHGLLHLCGYDDSTDVLKAEMTRLEDLYLEQISL